MSGMQNNFEPKSVSNWAAQRNLGGVSEAYVAGLALVAQTCIWGHPSQSYESRSLSWQGREGTFGPAYEMRLDINRSAHATV